MRRKVVETCFTFCTNRNKGGASWKNNTTANIQRSYRYIAALNSLGFIRVTQSACNTKLVIQGDIDLSISCISLSRKSVLAIEYISPAKKELRVFCVTIIFEVIEASYIIYAIGTSRKLDLL